MPLTPEQLAELTIEEYIRILKSIMQDKEFLMQMQSYKADL